MSSPHNYMHPLYRLGRFAAVATLLLVGGCDFLTGPEEIKLAYEPVVLRDQPTAGRVLLGVMVTNLDEREVEVSADGCAVGYRLELGPITHENDPRGCVVGLSLPGAWGRLATGDSLRIQGYPLTIASLGPSGAYTLTILVEHAVNNGSRYREIPAGEFVIP